jgi:calcium-dependent protein kinase
MGAFSKVFRVENKKTNEVFACKELIKTKIKDEEKFRNEIEIMSKCDHPNIVKLIEIYEDKRYYDIITEELCGGTLLERLMEKMEDDGETFSEKDAAIIFKQIISAINYCHKKGIVHRDLKMENVLFVDKGNNLDIKIIDFGLSQYSKFQLTSLNDLIVGDKTITMFEKVGTAHYVSPEVLKGKYNQKCDIWSAGVILYAMLSGTFPFKGKSDKEIYKSILKRKYEYPDKIWKKISKEAKDLINNMLCKQEKRFSAEQVLNHKWFKNLSQNISQEIPSSIILELKNYKNTNHFKRFILTILASRLNEQEIKELRNTFFNMDINKDGVLSLEEVKISLKKFLKENEIEKMFEEIDINNSNNIEYSEFISALIEKKEYLKEETLMEIFKTLDKDNKGKINKDDIKKILNNQNLDENEYKQFIDKFDLNGDGEIDYYEFITNMNKTNIS